MADKERRLDLARLQRVIEEIEEENKVFGVGKKPVTPDYPGIDTTAGHRHAGSGPDINDKNELFGYRKFEKNPLPGLKFSVQRMIFELPEVRAGLDRLKLTDQERAELEAEKKRISELMRASELRLKIIDAKLTLDDILQARVI